MKPNDMEEIFVKCWSKAVLYFVSSTSNLLVQLWSLSWKT